MLVLSRKIDQSIVLDGGQVRLAIQAPREVTILRAELRPWHPVRTGRGPGERARREAARHRVRRRALAEAASDFAPVDVATLDPPEYCDRCRRPILPEDPITYLTEGDALVAIVHESCG